MFDPLVLGMAEGGEGGPREFDLVRGPRKADLTGIPIGKVVDRAEKRGLEFEPTDTPGVFRIIKVVVQGLKKRLGSE